MDDDGSGVFQKPKGQKSIQCKISKDLFRSILCSKNDYIKYTRICRKYSGRKIRATGYVYLKGSTDRDAKAY